MPQLQTREAKIMVALAKVMRGGGLKRNVKTDEMERYSEFNGDLGDIVKTIIEALDQ